IENAIGYLADGILGWIQSGRELEQIPQISGQEAAELQQQDPGGIVVLDVREPGEVAAGAIPGSIRIPLAHVQERAGELDRAKLVVVHCQGGYRSSVATSLLRHAGFANVANMIGGFDGWKAARLPWNAPEGIAV
ncbi:MAG TPA: rhodanese-like domain-containing protein, partial [Terriglobia bacterium]|nr:rhodanese-like domain-containing protein [Terriglobia bacterium]